VHRRPGRAFRQGDVGAVEGVLGEARGIAQYIAKLADTEFHIITKRSITDLCQLAGKKVDFYVKESGTALVGQDLFAILGIPVEPSFSFADEELRQRTSPARDKPRLTRRGLTRRDRAAEPKESQPLSLRPWLFRMGPPRFLRQGPEASDEQRSCRVRGFPTGFHRARRASAAPRLPEAPLHEDERAGPPGMLILANEPVTVAIPPVTGASDTAIALNLKPPVEGLRFVLFKDIPADVKFSVGFRMRNAWIASIEELNKLQILAPPGFAGPLIFDALFHRDSQTSPIAHGLVVVDVRLASAIATSPTAGTFTGQERPTPKPAPPPRPSVSAEGKRRSLRARPGSWRRATSERGVSSIRIWRRAAAPMARAFWPRPTIRAT
jgi:hypothetical protein